MDPENRSIPAPSRETRPGQSEPSTDRREDGAEARPGDPQDAQSGAEAAEHVAEAHRRLSLLRGQGKAHPDLEEAIRRLETALSILTTKTGGML